MATMHRHLLQQNAQSLPTSTTSTTMSRPLSILLGIVLCISLLLLLLVSLLQCLSRNRRSCDQGDQNPASSSQVGHAIPVIIFCRSSSSDQPSASASSESCSICLSDFEDGDEIKALPRCNHAFHKVCIDQWLPMRSSSCPVCREPVVDGTGEPTSRPTNCQNNLNMVMLPPPFLALH